MQVKRLLMGCILGIMAILLTGLIAAQEATSTPGASIELTGQIGDVTDTTLVINGLTIDITTAVITGELRIGATVAVAGNLTPQGTIVALTVTVIDGTATLAPTLDATETSDGTRTTPTPSATPINDGDVIIVIEGPIQDININIITIYNINISVDINNPILNLIQIGDVIYVEGLLGIDGILVATLINNLSEAEDVADGASVGIQGPVEAIEGNRVTVNGIIVQLDENDPLLSTLVIGDVLDVQGNFVLINNIYILIVVNIIVIDIDINNPEYCWWHNDGMGMGMGGHWHCDGMGMGMGMGSRGMGMGS